MMNQHERVATLLKAKPRVRAAFGALADAELARLAALRKLSAELGGAADDADADGDAAAELRTEVDEAIATATTNYQEQAGAWVAATGPVRELRLRGTRSEIRRKT